MPKYRRWYAPGATYFFTVVTEHRVPFLCEPPARKCLGDAFWGCRERWPFTIQAIVLLPDHLHTIWSLPAGDARYSARWAWIKRTFTASWLQVGGRESSVSEGKRAQRRCGVWQPRFWEHLIRDEPEREAYADYIHYNPVKHGLVQRVSEWPYSSFHRFVREGHYDPHWASGGQPDFRRLDLTTME